MVNLLCINSKFFVYLIIGKSSSNSDVINQLVSIHTVCNKLTVKCNEICFEPT